MDRVKQAEEALREAACLGNEDTVKALVKSGVNVNAQHSVNGWTPLHWASKRGYVNIVHFLLSCGADPNVTAVKGEKAADFAASEEIRQLLSSGRIENSEKYQIPDLPITPNYLAHPAHCCKANTPMNPQIINDLKSQGDGKLHVNNEPELVLKVRTSYPPNQDFIEVEIPYKDLSYASVMKICCEELEIMPQKVLKLRKLPNTILRKDKDVLRLCDFAELEIVQSDHSGDNTSSMPYLSSATNGYIDHPSDKSEKHTNPAARASFIGKSNFLRNGTVLY